MLFGIIISSLAILACIFIGFIEFSNKQYGWGILWIVLLVLNIGCLIHHCQIYNAKMTGELQTIKVENVVSYTVDTTTVINGMDTTQLYTITYQKEYE